MARISELDKVLFPVEERPVLVQFRDDAHQGRPAVAVRGKKALVDPYSRRVLGLVASGYRLVTNQEALDLAFQCCSAVFPTTSSTEWHVDVVDAPATAGVCHFDLLHNSTGLNFDTVPPAERPEIFGPFIRMTNSYNGTRALRFDVGFYRKVCSNGLILPQSVIQFRFNHQHSVMRSGIQFKVAHDRLEKMKQIFTQSLSRLRACAVPMDLFEPAVLAVLCVNTPREADADTAIGDEWRELGQSISVMSRQYAAELGANAYAVFNCITELASRHRAHRCIHRDRHGLQRLAGAWLNRFNAECIHPEFSFDEHLKTLMLERGPNQGNPTAVPGQRGEH